MSFSRKLKYVAKWHRMHCLIGGMILILIMGQAVEVTAAAEPVEPSIPVRFSTAVDLSGNAHRLCADPEVKATGLVFMTSECPLCRKSIPELNRIADEFSKRSAVFLGVLYDPSLTRNEARKFAEDFGVDFPILFDASGELANYFKPTHVPEAFVLNGEGVQTYRGRINDLYAEVNKPRPAISSHDLRMAMEKTLAGEILEPLQTPAVGCRLPEMDGQLPEQVTYYRDVAPILNAHCAECHREGEVAPFPLLTYEDAAKRSDWLSEVTESRLMPPWRAETGHEEFLGERRLSDFSIALLKAWAQAGNPEGSPEDSLPVPQFPSGWRLGQPDVVLKAPAPFTVPADGPDLFQHFVIPMGLTENKTLIGFDFKPSNPAVVHHAVLFLDTGGYGRAKDAETPEPGYITFGSIGIPTAGILGVWTPGMTPRFHADGMGLEVPAGADLILQLHMHPSGKEESDQSSVAFYFSDDPPTRQISRSPILLGSLIVDIPAGEPLHEMTNSVTVPSDITLVSVLPHMHLLGKELKVTATLPDGEELIPIWIKDWNFYWQDNYVYRKPLTLPAGTELKIYASYDNSEENPFNPTSPPKRVLFGNGSTDEMCFAIFQFVADEPRASQGLQLGLRQSFMRQWSEAKLDAEARNHIVREMMKLFGVEGDASLFMRRLGGGGS
jgi:thiol-disulfide isomerase/thioredoxin